MALDDLQVKRRQNRQCIVQGGNIWGFCMRLCPQVSLFRQEFGRFVTQFASDSMSNPIYRAEHRVIIHIGLLMLSLQALKED